MQLTVKGRKFWDENVYSLFFEEPTNHKPGQFLMVKALGIARAYSLANLPGKPAEFIIKAVGRMSNYLKTVEPGTKIEVFGPLGHFTLGNEKKSIFVAIGVGITPIISMLRYLEAYDPKRESVLIYGTRYEDKVIYGDYLRSLEEKMNFRLELAVSRPKEGEGKHVQDVLPDFIDPKAVYYICGTPAMGKEVINMLAAAGVPKERIRAELY